MNAFSIQECEQHSNVNGNIIWERNEPVTPLDKDKVNPSSPTTCQRKNRSVDINKPCLVSSAECIKECSILGPGENMCGSNGNAGLSNTLLLPMLKLQIIF